MAVPKKLTGFEFTGVDISQLSVLVTWLGVQRTALVQPGRGSSGPTRKEINAAQLLERNNSVRKGS